MPTVVLGAGYELYFTMARWPDLGWAAIAVLPTSIVPIGSTMPVLLLLGTAAGPTRAAIQIVLATQMINLEGIYGVDRFALWLQPMYSVAMRTGLALVLIACFAVIGRELYRVVSADPVGRAAILEGSGG